MAHTLGNRDVLVQQWTKQQEEGSTKVIVEDDADFSLSKLKYVGGLDVTFSTKRRERGCITLSCLAYPSMELLWTFSEVFCSPLPYVSGYLAFREALPAQNAIDMARQKHPTNFPQIILIDGNGVWHPRGFGSASHLGVLCDIPTIGVAKTCLYVENVSEKEVKEMVQIAIKEKKDCVEVKGHCTGRVLGMAAVFGLNVTNCTFISVGHRISLTTATEIIRVCCLSRVAAPIAAADHESRVIIKKFEEQIDDDPDAFPDTPNEVIEENLSSFDEVKGSIVRVEEEKAECLSFEEVNLSVFIDTSGSTHGKVSCERYFVFNCFYLFHL
jgi:endonuclease V